MKNKILTLVAGAALCTLVVGGFAQVAASSTTPACVSVTVQSKYSATGSKLSLNNSNLSNTNCSGNKGSNARPVNFVTWGKETLSLSPGTQLSISPMNVNPNTLATLSQNAQLKNTTLTFTISTSPTSGTITCSGSEGIFSCDGPSAWVAK